MSNQQGLRQRKSHSNGPFVPTAEGRKKDIETDTHQKYEFGGPPGVVGMMVGFPMLMYYLWICIWFYQGKFVRPTSVEDIKPFLSKMVAHVQQDARPTAWAAKSYLGLMAFQLALAFVIPGKKQQGLPVASLNYKTLTYHCNALGSWYITLLTALSVHFFGLFDLTKIIDNFGHLMTVAMMVGFALTTAVYFGSVCFGWGGKPLRMSGNFFYDYFMGAALNPRIGSVDLKMWQEIRIPWILLFLIALSATLKQYQTLGYVTSNMAFMLVATALYLNACAKGEEMIPTTIDMIHEKDGFMLTFWNFAGVPFTYSYSILYLHRMNPEVYQMSITTTIGLFSLLTLSYYIFDTANSQKSIFRMEQNADYTPRASFPQLPWRRIENPTYIETSHGSKLLTSGWFKFAVKPHYTADLIQSLTWGLSTGLSTPIAYFYPVWFLIVLTHRCGRDFEKCAAKYGKDWDRYMAVVKYKFIPGVY